MITTMTCTTQLPLATLTFSLVSSYVCVRRPSTARRTAIVPAKHLDKAVAALILLIEGEATTIPGSTVLLPLLRVLHSTEPLQ